MKRRALLAALALAGCTPSTDHADNQTGATDNSLAVSVPGPDQAIAAGALPTPELDGVAVAQGRWRLVHAAGGDVAIFDTAAKGAAFALRCDRAARRIQFIRAGVPAAPGGMLRIVTSTGASSYPAVPRNFAPGAIANIPLADGFLTASLAKAEGPIGVKMGDGPVFAVAADAAIGEVIGGCAAVGRAQSS